MTRAACTPRWSLQVGAIIKQSLDKLSENQRLVKEDQGCVFQDTEDCCDSDSGLEEILNGPVG